jgi:DNA polymerase V
MLVELQPQALRRDGLEFSAGFTSTDNPARADCSEGESVSVGSTLRNRARLMATLDDLSSRYGRDMLRLAAAGFEVDQLAWAVKQGCRSPGYTTRWEDMPIVRM